MLSSVHPSMRKKNQDEIRVGLEKGIITQNHLQHTQDRIVHLMYTLTTAVLKSHEEELLKSLGRTLTFQTSEFDDARPYTGLYACGGVSEEDDTLAKFTIVDYVTKILGKLYPPMKK